MKKILVLGMVVILSLAVLAGCGQDNQVAEQPAQEPQVQSQEPVESQPADQAGQNQQGIVYEDGIAMDPADYDLISEDKAKEIALGQVEGAALDNIWAFDLDYDDGLWKYEGEIHLGEWEYEFEINAESGDVIGLEKDHIYD